MAATPGSPLSRREIPRPRSVKKGGLLRAGGADHTPWTVTVLRWVMIAELLFLAIGTLAATGLGIGIKLVCVLFLPLYGFVCWRPLPAESCRGGGNVLSVLRYIAFPPLVYYLACGILLAVGTWFLSLF